MRLQVTDRSNSEQYYKFRVKTDSMDHIRLHIKYYKHTYNYKIISVPLSRLARSNFLPAGLYSLSTCSIYYTPHPLIAWSPWNDTISLTMYTMHNYIHVRIYYNYACTVIPVESIHRYGPGLWAILINIDSLSHCNVTDSICSCMLYLIVLICP